MPDLPTEAAHLTSYARLFVELHRLVAKGAGDSDEADVLRDQLDRPWYKLSDVEKRMTDILAINLYDFDEGRYEKVPSEQLVIDLHLFRVAGLEESPEAKGAREELDRRLARLDAVQRKRLSGILADLRSIGVSRDAVPADSKQAAKDFQAATKRHEWDLALTMLREHESEISPAELAAMRGVCWAQLGNHEVAALFFGEAVRLNPTNIEIESCYLRSLIRCGRLDDARRNARFIVNKKAGVYRQMLAADILFDCLMASSERKREECEEIVSIVDRAAIDPTAAPGEPHLRQLVCSAYLGAAICCDHLGDLAKAEKIYNTAHLFCRSDSEAASRNVGQPAHNGDRSQFADAIQLERTALGAGPFPIAFTLSMT
ncbi:MAG TPA: hypothetical protein VFW87_14750 [Pirellulales bacterium]|nr:hypothetical protein [Pirellulales bacterium]